MNESKYQVDFEEIANQLIDAGAEALVTPEDLLSSKQLLVSIHGIFADERETIHSICEDIDTVCINGQEFTFDYVCDPYPPTAFGMVSLYVPTEWGGENDLSLTPATINEGLKNAVTIAN